MPQRDSSLSARRAAWSRLWAELLRPLPDAQELITSGQPAERRKEGQRDEA